MQNNESQNLPTRIVMESVEMVEDQEESLKNAEDKEKAAIEIHTREGNNNNTRT